MKQELRNIIDPVDERRATSGSLVRMIYAAGIMFFFGVLAWNFSREIFFLEGTGTISAKKSVIAFPFPVRINQVGVEPGTDVKKGDLIATIESFSVEQIASQIVIQTAEIAAKIAEIEVRLSIAKGIEPFARKRLVMTSELLARLEAGSDGAGSSQYKMQVYLDSVSAAEFHAKTIAEINGSVDQLLILKQQLVVLDVQHEKIKDLLLDGRVFASMDAVLSSQVPIQGEVIPAGTPLFTLYDRNELFVIWEMPLRRFVEPQIGDRVYMTSGYVVIEGHIDGIFPISTGQGSDRSTQFTGIFQGQRARVRNRGFDKFLPIESQVVVRMSYSTLVERLFAMLEPSVPR